MLALQAFTPEPLAEALGITAAEARKIVAAVHRGERFEPATRLPGVRRSAMAVARSRGHVPTLEVRAVRPSAIDPFVKLALATGDGHVIEAVRIPLERAGRFSACVSSQAGCALACAFCATGRLGLARNLEVWEIVEQVRLLRATLGPGERVHGVVFQGMGEPLANVDRVIEAIRVMNDPCALAIDSRAITVCTSGLPSGIRQLAREVPKVRLGVSIGSARPAVRRRLMPIDAAHSLEDVLAAVEEHARVTGLAPMWAVTPLAGRERHGRRRGGARGAGPPLRGAHRRAPAPERRPVQRDRHRRARSLRSAATSRASSTAWSPAASAPTCATAAAATSPPRADSSLDSVRAAPCIESPSAIVDGREESRQAANAARREGAKTRPRAVAAWPLASCGLASGRGARAERGDARLAAGREQP